VRQKEGHTPYWRAIRCISPFFVRQTAFDFQRDVFSVPLCKPPLRPCTAPLVPSSGRGRRSEPREAVRGRRPPSRGGSGGVRIAN
jgi:hypothetical protein